MVLFVARKSLLRIITLIMSENNVSLVEAKAA